MAPKEKEQNVHARIGARKQIQAANRARQNKHKGGTDVENVKVNVMRRIIRPALESILSENKYID
jgi:hypothetical protein